MPILTPHFTHAELACTCGACGGGDRAYLLTLAGHLENLREVFGGPLRVLSGHRCARHPIEAAKKTPGTGPHVVHFGVDLAVGSRQAYDLVAAAPLLGWTGIGPKQRKAKRALHLDRRPVDERALWTYGDRQ